MWNAEFLTPQNDCWLRNIRHFILEVKNSSRATVVKGIVVICEYRKYINSTWKLPTSTCDSKVRSITTDNDGTYPKQTSSLSLGHCISWWWLCNDVAKLLKMKFADHLNLFILVMIPGGEHNNEIASRKTWLTSK